MMEGRPGADSEEKREPVSDIDTVVVDSLKKLDPNGRLEKLTSDSNRRILDLTHLGRYGVERFPLHCGLCTTDSY